MDKKIEGLQTTVKEKTGSQKKDFVAWENMENQLKERIKQLEYRNEQSIRKETIKKVLGESEYELYFGE